MASYNFDDQSVRRIQRAVRKIEQLRYDSSDQSTPGRPVYGGDTLPDLQYQYMVIQATSQNQIGGDWVRAHPLL